MDWIDLVQDRDRYRTFVNAVMNLPFPQKGGNFLTSFGRVSCSGKAPFHGVIYLLFINLLVSYLVNYLIS